MKKITPLSILLIGLATLMLSGLNWHFSIAAWLAPIFLLKYSRMVKWKAMWLFYAALSLVGAISMSNNNLLGLPEVHVFNGFSFGLLTIIPYIIDKLLYKKNSSFYYTLIFPCSIALVEYLVSLLIGTWGSIAHTQYEFKAFIQLASLFGIYSIWFMISWFASSLNWIIENKTNKSSLLKASLLYGGLFSSILIYSVLRIAGHKDSKQKLKLAAVISENKVEDTMGLIDELSLEKNAFPKEIYSDSVLIQKLIDRTKQAAHEQAKVIVWNELALVLTQSQKTKLTDSIKSICQKYQAYVAISFIEECQEPGKKPFNNISILMKPDGTVAWNYLKCFLEPNAEAPLINAGNFELPVLSTPYGKLSSVICSDLDFQPFMKQLGHNSVDMLMVPAMDWPGITPLHAQMAAIQAIQFGCNIVRVNGNGQFEVHNYMGQQIETSTPQNTNGFIQYAELELNSANTVYSMIGDTFIGLCGVYLLLMITVRSTSFYRKSRDI